MRHRQMASTLIELMIGLLLSSVLIGGIGSLFLQTHKVILTQREINGMMEDGRYALDVLQKEIRRAGGLSNKLDANGGEANVFFDERPCDPNCPPETVLPISAISTSLSMTSGEFIKGDTIKYIQREGQRLDALVVRYQLLDVDDLSRSGLSVCTHNSILEPGEDPAIQINVVNVYFFVKDNSLFCTSQRSVNSKCLKNCNPFTLFPLESPFPEQEVDPSKPLPFKLAENVENLTIRYGIDSDNPRNGVANYYVSAFTINESLKYNDSLALNWGNVIDIRISLMLKSQGNNLLKTQYNSNNQANNEYLKEYFIEGEKIDLYDKNSLYKIFSTTITIRNRLNNN